MSPDTLKLTYRFLDDPHAIPCEGEAVNASTCQGIALSYDSTLWQVEKFRENLAAYGHVELALDAASEKRRCYSLYRGPVVIEARTHRKGGALGLAGDVCRQKGRLLRHLYAALFQQLPEHTL